MAESQHQPSSSPPQKYRDPILTKQSKDELMEKQEKYIGGIVKSAAHKTLRQGKMFPTQLRIGTDGKKKLYELENQLRIEQRTVLNMAFAYAYTEAKRRQLSADELRVRIQSMQLDETYVSFEINEQVLDILFESSTQDAQFIYLNAGLNLLYSRLIQTNTPSTIWK